MVDLPYKMGKKSEGIMVNLFLQEKITVLFLGASFKAINISTIIFLETFKLFVI